MTTGQQKSKGNPAAKRMGNENRKARRSLSWRRGQERKRLRREAQARRERANAKRRAEGLPTAAEEARAVRRAARKQRKESVA